MAAEWIHQSMSLVTALGVFGLLTARDEERRWTSTLVASLGVFSLLSVKQFLPGDEVASWSPVVFLAVLISVRIALARGTTGSQRPEDPAEE